MKFLLDSNAFVVWIAGGRFDRGLRRRIEHHRAAVSAATSYELGLKIEAGTIRLPMPVAEAIPLHRLATLDITHAHAHRAARLPRHHRDPWDRILIAQAQLGGMTIVTRDRVFEQYDVDVVGF